MATRPELHPDRAAAARITALLVEHGYPPDRVEDWWQEPRPDLGDRSPMDAWQDGEHEVLLRVVQLDYARSEWAVRRATANDAFMAHLRETITERDASPPARSLTRDDFLAETSDYASH